MMRSKSLLMLAALLMCSLLATAQDTNKIKKEIANIKKSSHYLYGEGVGATAQEAHDLAEDLLNTEVNRWVDSQKKLTGKTIVVSNKEERHSELSLPRGNMFRCFIYVKKSDIITAENATIVRSDDASATAPQAAPKTEPAARPRQASAQAAPAAAPQPVQPASAQAAPAAAPQPAQPQVALDVPEPVRAVATCTRYQQMAEKIKELKAAGKIGHYARYGNLERPEIYYLVIYNQQGGVETVLTPGADRINVRTGQPDKVTNYHGCGAIGFTINK